MDRRLVSVAGLGWIAALSSCLFLAVGIAHAQGHFEDQGRLGPGEAAVFEILVGPSKVDRIAEHPRAPTWHVTDAADTAAALAPAWVRPALLDKLGQLDDDVQDALAAVLVEAHGEDPRFVDEVAFVMAHLSVADLTYVDDGTGTRFDPELLLDNARLIYQADAQLDYVTLIDEGDPATDDDYDTTARYRILQDGQETTVTLTPEQYYWWVVHPKISAEPVLYIHPPDDRAAAKADGGRFWREYLLADRGMADDFSRPFVLRSPNQVDDGDLNGWGPSAAGYVTSRIIDPIREIVRTSDGKAVLLRYAFHPEGTNQGYNGTILATTMPMEQAYESGRQTLFENLLSLGDGNVKIRADFSGNRFLVIKDRDPFGHPTVETALTALGYDFDVIDSTAFSQMTGWQDIEDGGYEKVVVPSDQPRLLYERLSAHKDIIEGWVGRSAVDDDMVFQFDGAVAPNHLPADDWSDLEMPGGLHGHALDEETDQVRPFGYPKLMDVMQGCSDLWDGQVEPDLSGDRFFDPNSFALDRLGYLVSQNLDDNVSELPGDWAGPDGDCWKCVPRSVNAARIAYGHYENCGGIAILLTAMSRTALVPVAKVSGLPEDHEWNEFLLSDAWHSYQVDWSDGATRIDRPGNAQDKDYGGGKDLSMVFAWRGDGLAIDDMDRYSKTVTVSLDVTDASGLPVDGASVLVATETYYNPDSLMVATVEVTDASGHAEFPVGDHQNYFIRVDSPAGVWPDRDHVQWVACAEPGASGPSGQVCPDHPGWDPTLDMPTTDETGARIDVPVTLDGTGVPVFDATAQQVADGSASGHLVVHLSATQQVRYLPSMGIASEMEQGGRLDLYLLDFDNMNRFAQKQPFAYRDHVVVRDAPSDVSLDIDLPDDSDAWYLLVANDHRVSTATYYDMALDVSGGEQQDAGVPDGGLEGGGGRGGCSCRSSGSSGFPSLLWLLFVVVLRSRKWRDKRGDRSGTPA